MPVLPVPGPRLIAPFVHRFRRAFQAAAAEQARIEPMSGYRGLADLMLEDRPENTVQANFTTNSHDLRKPWSGYLITDSPALLTVAGGTSGRIRLPNGREGALICQDVRVEVGSSGLSIRIVILGEGDAPY